MYQVYLKEDSKFDSRKLLGEFKELDDAYDLVDAELAKDGTIKYIIEETTGHVDNYGELIPRVVEEN